MHHINFGISEVSQNEPLRQFGIPNLRHASTGIPVNKSIDRHTVETNELDQSRVSLLSGEASCGWHMLQHAH